MAKPLCIAMANIFFCLLLLSSLIASPLEESTRIIHEHHIVAGEEAPDRHVSSDDGFGEMKRAQPRRYAPPAPLANEERDPPTFHG
uniref:Uncharacterized protein n=1 Tax=Avena sativa TaxID=4498 RepID=A0ACD5V2U1_AVESA